MPRFKTAATHRTTTALLAALALGAASAAHASTVSGNPFSDGWEFSGNSLDAGTYVRGSGAIDYAVYTNSFTVASFSNLLGGGWSEGDSVLGIGGVVNNVTANLTQSVRIVAKFGTSETAWSPAPTAQGSFSSGHGGDGAVLLGTYSPANASSGGHLNPTEALNYLPPGSVYTIPLAQRYDSGSTSDVSTNIGKLIFQFDANNVLSSWQVLLNLTILEGILDPGDLMPDLGDRAIMTLQRSNNSSLFTDALATIEEASSVIIPLPTPGLLGLAGLAGLVAIRRRRSL